MDKYLSSLWGEFLSFHILFARYLQYRQQNMNIIIEMMTMMMTIMVFILIVCVLRI